jgi:hypothetical protein
MAEFDHGIKLIADTSGRELARLAGVACGPLRPLESTLPATTELLADRAFRASRGRERFVLYFEFYTKWDRDAPWDILAKAGLLSRREHLPTVSLVFVLTPHGYHAQGGQFRLEAAGQPTQQLWFREVCLWEMEPQAWWESVPGLMTLYPLCRHGQAPPESVRHAADVIERDVASAGERADLLYLLEVFGELAFPRLDVAEIIGRDKMIFDSKFGRELKREAELKRLRTDLLKVLRSHWGEEAVTEFTPALNAIENLKRLERLFDQALAGMGLDEFRAALAVAKTKAKNRR